MWGKFQCANTLVNDYGVKLVWRELVLEGLRGSEGGGFVNHLEPGRALLFARGKRFVELFPQVSVVFS